MFPVFDSSKNDRDDLKRNQSSAEWSMQGSFYDFDDYDEDGNLIDALDSYRYQDEARSRISRSTVDYSRSASGSWFSGVRNWWSQNVFGSLSEEKKEEKFLRQQLNTVGRAVNSVRNFGGANKTEQKIKVVFAKTGQRNNVMSNNELYLSPDPLIKTTTLKPDWDDDQRCDVVIGEALTLLGMKRISNPMILREITAQAKRDEQRIEQLSKLRGMENVDFTELREAEETFVDQDLLRMLTCVMWRSVEQDAARAGILKEYRGSLPFFAAVQAYYSSDQLRTQLEAAITRFAVDGLPPEMCAGISVQATRVLIWNLNHTYNHSMRIEIPDCELNIVLDQAQQVLEQAVQQIDTTERYNKCYEAAELIAKLEPPQPEQEQSMIPPDMPDTPKGDGDQDTPAPPPSGPRGVMPPEIERLWDRDNGNQNQGFDPIENVSGKEGEVDVDDIPDEISDGLTEASEHCRIVKRSDTDTYYLDQIRDENRLVLSALRRKLEPCSEMNVLPEHGLRSGRMSHNRLWKVGTNLIDNDRIFHRQLNIGETKQMKLVLLVDFSGSMSGREIWIAKRMGVLIHDALRDFPQVSFEIWGHEGSGNHNNIYSFDSVAAFTSQNTGGGTDEGGAYACVAKQMIKNSKPSDRKVLMALGDGDTNREVVSNAVTLARRGGVETLNLLIGGEYHRENSEAAYGKGCVILLGNERDLSLDDEILRYIQPWLLRTISKLQKQVV